MKFEVKNEKGRGEEDEDREHKYKSNKTNFLILFKRERRRLITVLNWCFLETNRDKLRLERSAYRESRSGLYTGITMFAKRRRQIFLVLFFLFFFFWLKKILKRDPLDQINFKNSSYYAVRNLREFIIFFFFFLQIIRKVKFQISDIFEKIEYPWKIINLVICK